MFCIGAIFLHIVLQAIQFAFSIAYSNLDVLLDILESRHTLGLIIHFFYQLILSIQNYWTFKYEFIFSNYVMKK